MLPYGKKDRLIGDPDGTKSLQLKSAQGLENVTSVGSLTIAYCPQLTDLTALDGITTAQRVEILNNAALTNLAGLKVESCESLLVSSNGNLTSLTGLESLKSVTNTLYIGGPQQGNAKLTSLSGLGNLTTVGYIFVTDNPLLASVDGLEQLEEVKHGMSLERLPVLSDSSALGSLRLCFGPLLNSVRLVRETGGVERSRNPLASGCAFWTDSIAVPMGFDAQCGQEHVLYHSCRRRACPQCGRDATERWLNRQRDLLLPVPYFHLVFALPSELRRVVHAKAAMQQPERVLEYLGRYVHRTALTDKAIVACTDRASAPA